ncbi:MAG: hypothetical protein H0W58_03940 [Acidobacteria bacterium]|nr:hypothetical protein [Acidobacteriota bacterium]
MELFNNLGAEVENLWRDKNYDETLFPAIAAQALKEANLPEKVPAWEVIEWTLNETQLPEQRDVHGNFGDPPITLYNSPRFHIDVYFWLQGTTAIHQHAFCGAFQVLHGSSIHSWYEFESREIVNAFTEVGNIKLKLCELLQVGDVQEIWAGKQYIHGLFHLDQPSATIVVRTHKSPMFLPQYSYHKPFLAIDPFFEEPNTIKKLQCLTALIRSNHPETDNFIADLLEKSDFQTTFTILSNVKNYLQTNQIDQYFNPDAPRNRFDALLEIVKKRHGALADVLPEVFAYQARLTEIVNRRSYIADPELRFFLALLMNVEGKEQIFALIKERFPDAEPLDKVLDWTFDLSQTKVLGLNIPNALGIADFGDLDLFILESMLKNVSGEEMRAALKTEYGMENSETVEQTLAEKGEKIRQAVIFQPLLD